MGEHGKRGQSRDTSTTLPYLTGYLHSPVSRNAQNAQTISVSLLYIQHHPEFDLINTMAISFKAQFIHWYIYFWQFLANRASIKQIQNNVQQTFNAENKPVVPPGAISSHTGIAVTKETFQSNQKWEVFHVKPKSTEGRKKVIVYWHGGAFIRGVSYSDNKKHRLEMLMVV